MNEGTRIGVSLSEEALWVEPGDRAPLLGTPKDMLGKALEMGVCFHRDPAFGEEYNRTKMGVRTLSKTDAPRP